MNLLEKTVRNALRVKQYTLRDNLVSFAIGTALATMLVCNTTSVQANESQGELAPSSIENETNDMGATQMEELSTIKIASVTAALPVAIPNVMEKNLIMTTSIVSNDDSTISMMQSSAGVNDGETVVQKEEQEVGPGVIDTRERKTMYSNASAKIYEDPNENSEVRGETNLNGTFEVYLDVQNGWYEVTTQDVYNTVWIKASELSDNPWPEPKSYTEEDLYILAHVLAGEAQSCDDREQQYVASVVMNRVAHPSFPNTVKGVVFQRNQYSCTRDGNYYREPTERNWANAQYILENGSQLPGNVVYQSGGRQGKGVYVKTRWHYYCY